jgi:aminoglycoside phosphotransferase (APT) family kinase protein
MTAILEECLPARLRGPATTITRMSAGYSGAGVYRVDANGESFVLKITGQSEDAAEWRRKLRLLELAAGASLAPPVVHTDEERRAVVSAFVADRSFIAQYGNPGTREAAIALLGQTLRRVHALPLTPDVVESGARDYLLRVWPALDGFPLPAFVRETVERVIAEEPPPSDRANVFSHNDVNPTNLVHDGERLLLVDWETAGSNDPWYDLAAIAMFLRMDPESCRALLAAYDGDPEVRVPARFDYNRRMMAALFGANCLAAARQGGHPGASEGDTLEATPSLGDFYQRLRAGKVNISTVDGQWGFGMAMLREAFGV